MGEGGNPWLAQAGLMTYMAGVLGGRPGGMGPPAQAYGNAYDGNAPDASPQRAASQESARESGPAPSGGSASFGGDRTLPAKKRGRIGNAAVTSRFELWPSFAMGIPCLCSTCIPNTNTSSLLNRTAAWLHTSC